MIVGIPRNDALAGDTITGTIDFILLYWVDMNQEKFLIIKNYTVNFRKKWLGAFLSYEV
jgi:hypothetical protein